MPNRIKYKYDRETLEKLVKDSLSIREVMTKLGISPISGGMHAHIKTRIKREGIDTSHFRGKGANFGSKHIGGLSKYTHKEILIVNKKGYRTKARRLRRALLEIGRQYRCYICGLYEWQGKQLKLEVEHLNGDVLDNRRNNVEFICPNCHSQTETFCKMKTDNLPK